MYETKLFADGKSFIEWTIRNVSRSKRAADMAGWDGAINYLHLDRDLVLLYKLEKAGASWSVCDLHLLLWGARETLREDVCTIGRFYHPEGSALWPLR